MENVIDNNELAKRFLLGSLSESERSDLEDSFLARDDFYQALLIAEDDLIDAYVRDELPATERALFEQTRLTLPHSRERVEFAQTLFNSVSGKAVVTPVRVPWWSYLAKAFPTQRPALGFTFAAALLVIVFVGLWFLANKRQTGSVPEQAKTIQPTPTTPSEAPTSMPTAEQQQLTRDEVNSKRTPTTETSKRTAPVFATFTLSPGLVRSENGSGPLVLPAEVTEVQLRLSLEGETHKKYRATLSTPEGRKIWSRDLTGGRPSTKSTHITFSLPADLFESGDYVMDLSGANADGKWESVADYSFRVVKK